MRRAIAFMVLLLLVAGLACHGGPRRQMRPPEVQIYDLPPADAAWTMQPPQYDKGEGLKAPSKSKDQPNPRGLGGAGAGGAGGGVPGGVGPGM